jgi:hypothetical protein
MSTTPMTLGGLVPCMPLLALICLSMFRLHDSIIVSDNRGSQPQVLSHRRLAVGCSRSRPQSSGGGLAAQGSQNRGRSFDAGRKWRSLTRTTCQNPPCRCHMTDSAWCPEQPRYRSMAMLTNAQKQSMVLSQINSCSGRLRGRLTFEERYGMETEAIPF